MTSHQFRRAVVAGVDGSDSALEAVRWAAAEAHRRGVRLRLVNACPWPNHHFGIEAMGIDYRKLFVGLAREQLAAAAAVAGQVVADLEIQQQVIVSSPVPVLVAESERAEVVVVGDRGLGGVTGLLVGSVAVGVAQSAACPVVVVRGNPPQEVDSALPVVVGVDGSELSEAALRFAFEAAVEREVSLVAVLATGRELVDQVLANVPGADTIAEGERILAERLAGWAEKYPRVPVVRVVSRDRPADQLLAQSRHAQLVVVGSRGRGSFSGLVLGSVSHALVYGSSCPVAVVRPDTTEAGSD